tara:strand:+ start:129 stop:536 length:408 start_codon:yes stop_codon:yes gene_type:complete
MLKVRSLSETDYDNILTKWWDAWGWTAPLKDFLPENGTGGLMVMDGDEPVCAGFVYLTNSSAAWCDWIISSNTYRKKPDRKEAISLLIDCLTGVCEKQGCKYVYALIKSKPLIETYKKLGFTQGDSYNTEMIKKI